MTPPQLDLTRLEVPRLEVKSLYKSFNVPVLSGVNLSIQPGEVHALMGANGAGKSTLSNIICGRFAANSGSLMLNGTPYQPNSIKAAESAGVRMVMQELNTVASLSVAENIGLGNMPARFGLVNWRALHTQAQHALSLVGLASLDVTLPMGRLGVGQQQLVEIAKALLRPCQLLILDEPTAALTAPEIAHLFAQINTITAAGGSVLYISHRMDEIQQIADTVSVLRDGHSVGTRAARDLSSDDIVELMTGEEFHQQHSYTRRPRKALALKIQNLQRAPLLHNINLKVYAGEILGISGLIGAGRTELLRALVGADPTAPGDSGELSLGHREKPAVINSPAAALALGIGLIPEDRKQHALLLNLSIQKNFSIANLRQLSTAGTWLHSGREAALAEQYGAQLSLRYHRLTQAVSELSGGNQQKVIIARMLYRNCDILLFDEPTRGIDMQTKGLIYQLLDQLAKAGKAIVLVSSEISELTDLCDRIAVMSAGSIAKVFERGEWSNAQLTAAAFSAYTEH